MLVAVRTCAAPVRLGSDAAALRRWLARPWFLREGAAVDVEPKEPAGASPAGGSDAPTRTPDITVMQPSWDLGPDPPSGSPDGARESATAAVMRDARARVVVADDHPLFRDGLARRIRDRPELDLVGEAGDGSTALGAIRDLRPDVAVLDIKMPRIDGIRLAGAVTQECLGTRVLILSAHLESALVFRALAAGARGFVSKDADRDEVCEAIIEVARGEVVLPTGLHSGLAGQIRANAKQDVLSLTLREREVLVLIAEGASAPEIGRQLHLSTGTVKTHMARMYEKLGVSDRAAAVAEAMRRGLLE